MDLALIDFDAGGDSPEHRPMLALALALAHERWYRGRPHRLIRSVAAGG